MWSKSQKAGGGRILLCVKTVQAEYMVFRAQRREKMDDKVLKTNVSAVRESLYRKYYLNPTSCVHKGVQSLEILKLLASSSRTQCILKLLLCLTLTASGLLLAGGISSQIGSTS